MAISVSRLRAAGLAKESTAGTPVTTPTRYLNIVPPDSFTPMIEPLPSKGIEALINMYPKITQGPGTLNGMKVKLEAEPDNMGEILQACFGADTKLAAGTAIVILTGVNDAIDFIVSATPYVAKIPNGVYAIAGLETAVAAAMNAALSNSFTATLSGSNFSISGTSAFILDFGDGPNLATSAALTLGYTATDTSSNTTNTATGVPLYKAGTTHKFIRSAVSALPTYTWWFDKTLDFPLFAGSMLDKLAISMKAKGIVEVETDWVGTVYDSADGTSESTAFSSLKPFVWANAVVEIDGVVKPGYDDFKLSLSNNVKADHALNNSIWPYVAYSEGFTPDLSMELFFEDLTQFNKFLAGTTAHVTVTLTAIQNAITYQLIIDIPNWYYKTANHYIPSNGPLKIQFSGLCQYNFTDGYDVQAVLINDVTTTY